MSGLRRWAGDLPWRLLRTGSAGGGRAGGVLRVWPWWSRVTAWWWRPRAVRPGALLLYHLPRHRGRAVVLRDGTVIHRGDVLVELHLDNPRTAGLMAGTRSSWPPTRDMAADLDALAEQVTAGGLGPVQAVHGVTLLAEGARRFGFEVRPLPRTWYWALVRYFMVGLLAVHHPEGWARVDRLRPYPWPGEIWMSRQALLARLEASRRDGARRA